eukprot:TRINITY_DN38446_c0_g1_i1.p1 TRINITY_DN38446_c0_g1~~TRINITY_DN38446_c0_g1_i1.p1  ORF type:complete len:293 (-),score=40.14 TRINITY_DN38446_c0_g1_i1:28-870(-)
MAEPTDDELVDICNRFLLSSPPGEFMEVVTDVKALLPADKPTLINSTAPATFREYNTEQMVVVDSPAGKHKVLISKYGEVAQGEYLDPKGNCVIQFDHIKQKVTGNRPISGELDSGLEGLRSAFENAAFKHQSEHYPQGATTVYGKDGNIIIAVSSPRFNPKNYWNGRWRAIWTYNNGNLTGHIKIQVHYYEEGNVQFTTDSTLTTSCATSGGNDGIAAAALKAIRVEEDKYQQALEASYSTMGETTFKALRRALPITRTKIDWNKIQSYRVGQSMSQKN